jgi:adenine-specific DNA-methyltransferase
VARKSKSKSAKRKSPLARSRTTIRRSGAAKPAPAAEAHRFPEATSLARPEAGQQARFRKRKPKVTYRYDSSLSPSMEWDGQNAAREHGEWLIACIAEASKLIDGNPPFAFPVPRRFTSKDGRVLAEVRNLADAADQLRRLSAPFLNWAGKAERLSFDVPTLPLFVHERLSTQAIIETLAGHRKDARRSLYVRLGNPLGSFGSEN